MPMHPRTGAKLECFGLMERLRARSDLRVIEPLGYLDFLALTAQARLVFTDSGGIQEETTVLGVPCLTFRENTERPITITEGTNRLIGTDPEHLRAALDDVLSGRDGAGRVPEHWDGRAAERIVAILLREWEASRATERVPALASG
jgi:UDP-N-acetylglucosamine 2-epimerase (non-hydrolysing)